MNTRDASDEGPRRVVIVDDHAAFADLLRIALNGLADFQCVGTACTMAQAVMLVHRTAPAIVVVDLMLGEDDGLKLIRQLRAWREDVVLVVASAQADTTTLAAIALAGGNGFAPKTGGFEELLSVLRSARPETVSVAPSLLPAATPLPQEGRLDRLTARESHVLTLMGQGASAPEIARVLGISLNTCRSHVRSVHAKLGVSTQLEAVLKAQQIGLIKAADA